jgi:hypothetical protein
MYHYTNPAHKPIEVDCTYAVDGPAGLRKAPVREPCAIAAYPSC